MTTLPLLDEPTPCAGRWELFDSRMLHDHFEAATLCSTCPVRDSCAETLHAVATTRNSMLGGSPEGTWAGRLIGRSQNRPGRCGTDAGYHHHRSLDETACGDCRAAHTAAEKRRNAARQNKAS